MVQDPFTQMVAGDIAGTATTEESSFLRQDQNLAAYIRRVKKAQERTSGEQGHLYTNSSKQVEEAA